jgi:MFS family permease
MRETLDVLLKEPGARRFFLAHAQSSLGTGAGYVALLVIAYERFESPWAITLVLLADFLPAMLLGPLFGAAADRWSRRWCGIASDVARAVAFVGIAFVGSIEATIALALLAGVGAGMFTPAILAGLPSLVSSDRLPAATSVYGAITDLGRTAGPALAAAILVVASAETVSVVNGATFALSALVLLTLRFGAAPEAEAGRPSLLRQAREGLAATARMPGVRVLILASSGILLFAGMMNVAELLLARELGAGDAGFSLLVATWGAGFVAGSLTGARARSVAELKRRYLGGLLVFALGLLSLAVVPALAVAFAAFAVVGWGNGLVIVHERLLMQRTVPDALMARAYAAADTLGSWAFAAAFLGAGTIVSLVGTRELFVVAGLGGIAVWAAASVGLRGVWHDESQPPRGEPAAALASERPAVSRPMP